MKISQAGIDLIKRFEGLRLEAYQDTGGVWSIGYGHIIGVKPGLKISRERAEKYLIIDLAPAELVVNAYVRQSLNQNQFDSLVNFVFNVGGGAFRKSTLLAVLNIGLLNDVPHQLLKWHHDNGKDIPGLLKRRQAEVELFMKPIT
jgi:lysozyme